MNEEELNRKFWDEAYDLGKMHGIELVCARFHLNHEEALLALGIKK